MGGGYPSGVMECGIDMALDIYVMVLVSNPSMMGAL